MLNYARCSQVVVKDICSGKYQIVILSPEMILTKKFIKGVFRNAELQQRILSVVVDEAHVISHWGAGFRKKYGELGILQTLLPKDVSFIALSATLAPKVRKDVVQKLHMSESHGIFVDINIGNDRTNVSLVARAMEHPMNTYRDVNFIIPSEINPKNLHLHRQCCNQN